MSQGRASWIVSGLKNCGEGTCASTNSSRLTCGACCRTSVDGTPPSARSCGGPSSRRGGTPGRSSIGRWPRTGEDGHGRGELHLVPASRGAIRASVLQSRVDGVVELHRREMRPTRTRVGGGCARWAEPSMTRRAAAATSRVAPRVDLAGGDVPGRVAGAASYDAVGADSAGHSVEHHAIDTTLHLRLSVLTAPAPYRVEIHEGR